MALYILVMLEYNDMRSAGKTTFPWKGYNLKKIPEFQSNTFVRDLT
jgi:hypothetical protein